MSSLCQSCGVGFFAMSVVQVMIDDVRMFGHLSVLVKRPNYIFLTIFYIYLLSIG